MGFCLTVELPAGGGGEGAVPRACVDEPCWVPLARPCGNGGVSGGLGGSLQCWQVGQSRRMGAHALHKMGVVLTGAIWDKAEDWSTSDGEEKPTPWPGSAWGGCGAGSLGGGFRAPVLGGPSSKGLPSCSVFQLSHQRYKPFVFAAETLADLSM